MYAFRRMRWIIVVCSSAVTSVSAIRAEASTLVAYEGFGYPSGLTTSSNGGQGWSSPWYLNSDLTGEPTATVFNAGSIPFPAGVTFTPTGNRIGDPQGWPNNVGFRHLAADGRVDLGTESVRYLSFLYATGSPGVWGGLSLWDSSGVEQLFFGVNASQFFLAGNLAGANSAGTAPGNQPLFMAVKIVSQASGSDEVYLQPYLQTDTVPSTEPSSWLISRTFSSSLVLDRIRIASGAGYEIDEIRVGTSWDAAVVGVPEPSAWMLVACAAAALPVAYHQRLRAGKRTSH